MFKWEKQEDGSYKKVIKDTEVGQSGGHPSQPVKPVVLPKPKTLEKEVSSGGDLAKSEYHAVSAPKVARAYVEELSTETALRPQSALVSTKSPHHFIDRSKTFSTASLPPLPAQESAKLVSHGIPKPSTASLKHSVSVTTPINFAGREQISTNVLPVAKDIEATYTPMKVSAKVKALDEQSVSESKPPVPHKPPVLPRSISSTPDKTVLTIKTVDDESITKKTHPTPPPPPLKTKTLAQMMSSDDDVTTSVKQDKTGPFSTHAEQYASLSKSDPGRAEVYFQTGVALCGMNKFDDAIGILNKAIIINPQHMLAYNIKGVALLKLKRIQEAIECFKKAIDIGPENADVYFNCGNALDALGKTAEAKWMYDQAIAIDPKYARSYKIPESDTNPPPGQDKGPSYKKTPEGGANPPPGQDKTGPSNPHTEQAKSKIDIKLAETYFRKGVKLFEQGDLEKALEMFRKVIKNNPDYHEAYQCIGGIYNRLKDTERAEEFLGKAARIIESKQADKQIVDNIKNNITLFDEGAEGHIKDDVVLVIGKTGAGKSSIMNILAGKKVKMTTVPGTLIKVLDVENKDYAGEIKTAGFELIKIGGTSKDNLSVSCTKFPNYIIAGTDQQFWDCPGFSDSRGAEDEISNMYYIHKILKRATENGKPGVKFVVVQDAAGIVADRGKSFKDCIKTICEIFEPKTEVDFQQLIDATTFVFNKVDEDSMPYTDDGDSPVQAASEYLSDILRKLKGDDSSDKEYKSFLSVIEKMHASDMTRIKHIELVKASGGVSDEEEAFITPIMDKTNGLVTKISATIPVQNVIPKLIVSSKGIKFIEKIYNDAKEELLGEEEYLKELVKEVFRHTDKKLVKSTADQVFDVWLPYNRDECKLDNSAATKIYSGLLGIISELGRDNVDYQHILYKVNVTLEKLVFFNDRVGNAVQGVRLSHILKPIFKACMDGTSGYVKEGLLESQMKAQAYDTAQLNLGSKWLANAKLGFMKVGLAILSQPKNAHDKLKSKKEILEEQLKKAKPDSADKEYFENFFNHIPKDSEFEGASAPQDIGSASFAGDAHHYGDEA